MAWTRRRFVTSAAAGAAGLSLGPRVWAADRVEDRFGEFPLAGLVEQFRADQAHAAGSVRSTGTTRDAYLDVISGIVRFFAAHQDARGAIVYPYQRAEKQTSTRRSRWPVRRCAWPAGRLCRSPPWRARCRSPARPLPTGRPPTAMPISTRSSCCMPTVCSPRRCRTRRRRPGAAILPASFRRRPTGDTRPRRRSRTGTSWRWPASGCARRPGLGSRCRGSRRRSHASWSCSRRGACTATPTTRWLTTTSRGCGRSTCSTRVTGAATPPIWRRLSSAARGCRCSCSRHGVSCRAAAGARTTSGTKRSRP